MEEYTDRSTIGGGSRVSETADQVVVSGAQSVLVGHGTITMANNYQLVS